MMHDKTWPRRRSGWPILAAGLVLALHALVIALVGNFRAGLLADRSAPPEAMPSIVYVDVAERPAPAAPEPLPAPAERRPDVASDSVAAPELTVRRHPATLAAPPPPTAEEWAFAAGYALKNGKGYRHNWGRQVRSMMGTAVEGADQGMVRFQVEIAPDGSLLRLEVLWSTSDHAERLARQAVARMPRLPPTPNGKPLIFERTIAFTPFASDDAPLYKDDCLPDPPTHRNRFVWDGRSPQVPAPPPKAETLDPQVLADCLKQLPKDSIEAEAAHDRRLVDQGRSNKLGP